MSVARSQRQFGSRRIQRNEPAKSLEPATTNCGAPVGPPPLPSCSLVPVGFSLSFLPFLVCWGGGVSCVGPQSPIRSRWRLSVGLGFFNKISVPPSSQTRAGAGSGGGAGVTDQKMESRKDLEDSREPSILH